MGQRIIDKYKCKSCGWSIIEVDCNEGMSDLNYEWSKWDWWVYCSNKSCDNHTGEGLFQTDPDWFESIKNNSKLEWEQNPPSNLMTWYKANEYANSLGNGWRLPTIKELEEAYDSKIEGFQSFNYWSSITYVQNTNYVWNVDFGNGFVDFNDETDDFFVRCVREVK